MKGSVDDFAQGIRDVLAADARVAGAYLFGSQVDGRTHPGSDIDLGLVLASDVPLRDELALGVNLDVAVGDAPVDVVVLQRAPIVVRYRALATGRLVYDADPVAVSDFIAATLREYFDFAPRLEAFHREFARSLSDTYGS